MNSWAKKWQNVFIEMNFEVGIWSPDIMCCCGQIHMTHEGTDADCMDAVSAR